MKKSIVLLCIVAATITACNTGKRSNKAQTDGKDKIEAASLEQIKSISMESADPAHNSRNSLDWSGVYKGILPCADCEGIQTEIRLNEDLTFEMVTSYLGKGENRQSDNGRFEWDETGGRIKLTSATSSDNIGRWFLVGENRLLVLDAEGNRITSGNPQANLFLEKIDMNNVITEKYWKLIELNGKEFTLAPDGPGRDAFFILKIEDNRVIGNTGCNSMNGSYTLSQEDDNGIRFSPLATTRMACVGVDHELEYLQVFETTDNYTVYNDTLMLRQGETPLARFVAVYLK